MPNFSPARKMLCANFPPPNSQPYPPRTDRDGGHYGEMHCIPVELCRGKSGLSRVDLALLAYIIENPEEQGARATIALECDCAPNSIPRAAKRLEALGFIERVPGGGTEHTRYQLGRNLSDTGSRNTEVTCNVQVTGTETPELRAANGVNFIELDTTSMVVTEVTGGRNIPPHTPLYITTTLRDKPLASTVSDNRDTEELEIRGGSGGSDLFGAEAKRPVPKGTKRRPKREAFRATDERMPREPSEVMAAYAKSKGMVNGTLPEQFERFRRWHIRENSLIKSVEQRWETWVDNWLDGGARQVHRKPTYANGVRPNPYLHKRIAR